MFDWLLTTLSGEVASCERSMFMTREVMNNHDGVYTGMESSRRQPFLLLMVQRERFQRRGKRMHASQRGHGKFWYALLQHSW